MTQVTVNFNSSGSFAQPAHLLSTTFLLQVYGASALPTGGHSAMFVTGTIPVTMVPLLPTSIPLTIVIGSVPFPFGSSNAGGSGFSGGGAGQAGGGAGSSAVLAGSPAVLQIEAGGGAGQFLSEFGAIFGAGGGGGFAGTGGSSASGSGPTQGGGGGGGGSGGNGGADGGGNPGGTGHGGGPSGSPGGSEGAGGAGGAGGGSGGVTLPSPFDGQSGSSFAASTVSSVQYNQSPTNAGGGVAITYTIADTPNIPTLISPSSTSFIDTNSLGVTFTGVYNPQTDSGALNAVALRLQVDGGSAEYWNGINFSSSTPQWIIPTTGAGAVGGESFSMTIPPGVLLDGHTYTWSFATQESNFNLQSGFPASFTLHGQVAPTCVITSPIVTTNSTFPTVSWGRSIPSGSSQINYRYLVYTSPTSTPGVGSVNPAGPWIFDTGVVSVGSTITSFVLFGPPLLSGNTYYGYLQIQSTGGNPSAWAEGTFELILIGGATPVLSGSASTEGTTQMPAPFLSMTFADSGITQTIFSEYQAFYPGTEGFADILGGNPVFGTQTASSVFDVGAPFNVPIQYQGRTFFLSGGQIFFSQWSNIVTVQVQSNNWWVVPPGDLGNSMLLHRLPSSGSASSSGAASPTSPAVPGSLVASVIIDEWEQMGVFRPFGKSTATIIHGDIWNDEFDLDLYFESSAEWVNFVQIRELKEAVLIKSDMEGSFYWVTLGPDLNPGIVSQADRQFNPTRGLTIHCTPTDPPS